MSRGGLACALAALSCAGALSAQPVPRIAASPYRTVRVITLPGSTVTPVIARLGGGYAVGLAAPPQLVFLRDDLSVEAIAPLEARPDSLTARADGAVLVSSEPGATFTVAPDGTVRDALTWRGTRNPSAWFSGDDGSLYRSAIQEGRFYLQVIGPAPYAQRRVAIPYSTATVTAVDARRAGLMTRWGYLCLDTAGRFQVVASLARVRVLSSLGGRDGVAFLSDESLAFAGPDGVPTVTLRLASPPAWVTPAPDGVAVLLGGASPTLVRYDLDGTLRSQSTVPAGSLGPRYDRTGALIIATNRGILTAFGPDGAERWRMNLGEDVIGPLVPRPEGGWLVSTARNGVMVLDEGAP